MFETDWNLPPIKQHESSTFDFGSLQAEKKKKGKEQGEGADRVGKPTVCKPSAVSRNYSRPKKMRNDLLGSRFRFLNEKLYTMDSSSAQELFKEDPQAFLYYHQGFAHQVSSWPRNPLDVFIARLREMKQPKGIIDMGCGEGRLGIELARSHHHIRSFDLVSLHPHIEVGDMCNLHMVPSNSADVAICCLSLMNTNYRDAIKEAWRILKRDGVLWIAEVRSRFPNQDVNSFSRSVSHLFKAMQQEPSDPVFVILECIKIDNPSIDIPSDAARLEPCLYKKR